MYCTNKSRVLRHVGKHDDKFVAKAAAEEAVKHLQVLPPLLWNAVSLPIWLCVCLCVCVGGGGVSGERGVDFVACFCAPHDCACSGAYAGDFS